MNKFWKGFTKRGASPVNFKKHTLLIFWSKSNLSEGVLSRIRRVALKYPSIKIKLINIEDQPTRGKQFGIAQYPTIVLLKNGKEVDRIVGEKNMTLVDSMFRRAHV